MYNIYETFPVPDISIIIIIIIIVVIIAIPITNTKYSIIYKYNNYLLNILLYIIIIIIIYYYYNNIIIIVISVQHPAPGQGNYPVPSHILHICILFYLILMNFI